MNIEFIYGDFSCGNKTFDFDHLMNQFLTGSETNCFFQAKYMAKLGHNVTIFTKLSGNETEWEGVKIKHLHNFYAARVPPDCFISYNEPNVLYCAWEGSVRIVAQQLNDFGYSTADFNNVVDIFISPSQSHSEYLQSLYPQTIGKWQVIPNCTDPSFHNPTIEKIKGRIIYASSPDRGLHLLLQEWPKIKKAVPFARLDIFYDFDSWYNKVKNISERDSLFMQEFKNRGIYIKRKLEEMKNGFDIYHHKNVPKNQIYKEMDKSIVLGFPCSTVAFTEGFSCTTLECMASGVVPVISKQDSLGQIYGNVCPIIDVPATEHMNDFSNKIIEILLNEEKQKELKDKCIEFSKEFYFENWSKKIEYLIQSNKKIL